jgi:hypothetical protein
LMIAAHASRYPALNQVSSFEADDLRRFDHVHVRSSTFHPETAQALAMPIVLHNPAPSSEVGDVRATDHVRPHRSTDTAMRLRNTPSDGPHLSAPVCISVIVSVTWPLNGCPKQSVRN